MWFINTPTKYALALAGIGLVMLAWAVFSLRTGRIQFRQTVYERAVSPILFHFFVLFLLAISGVSFLSAATIVFGTVT